MVNDKPFFPIQETYPGGFEAYVSFNKNITMPHCNPQFQE
jgi:hypothetical protein